MKNAAIEAAMIAQSYRLNHGRRLILPKFNGKRKNPRGRLYKSNRLLGRGAESPFVRFSDTSRTLNIANKAAPVLPFTQSVSGTEVLTTLVAVDDLYRIVYDRAINPADPTLFPRTSATVLQYQNYRVDAMTIRYVPSVATAVNGSVLFGIVPDPTAEAPTDVEQFQNLGGSVYDQVFGKTLSLPIAGNMMNTAYNRLFCAASGVAVPQGDNIVLGTLYLDFSFQVMNPKVETDSNGFAGAHLTATVASSAPIKIPATSDLVSGYSAFEETGEDGVMAFRMSHVPHLITIHVTNDDAIASSNVVINCRVTNTLADFASGTVLTADWSMSQTTPRAGVAQFSIPGSYRFAYLYLTDACAHTARYYVATRSR